MAHCIMNAASRSTTNSTETIVPMIAHWCDINATNSYCFNYSFFYLVLSAPIRIVISNNERKRSYKWLSFTDLTTMANWSSMEMSHVGKELCLLNLINNLPNDKRCYIKCYLLTYVHVCIQSAKNTADIIS